MTIQVPGQQGSKRGRKRVIFLGLAVVFLGGVAAIWIVNLGNALSSVLGIVFTLLGILIAFLQWQPQRQSEAHMQAGETGASGQGRQRFHEQIEGVVLEVNKRKGALLVYTRKDLRGSTLNLSFGFHDTHSRVDMASSVVGRKRGGGTIYLAAFSALEPGNYTVFTDARNLVAKVSILSGKVEEVDWQ